MGSVLIKILNSGGIGGAINAIIDIIASLLGGKIPEKAICAAGLVVAVLVGILGYKYIKLVSTISFGVVGYAIGLSVFRMAERHFGWDLPVFVDYLAGVAMLALLGYLAYKKFAYAMFVMVGALGFTIAYFIHPSYLLGAIFAVVVAMITMNFVRYGLIGVLSVSAGFVAMGMFSGIFPSVRWFNLTQGWAGKLLALLIAAVFVAIQLSMSKSESKNKKGNSIFGGPKRVKIRRVFDTW